MASEAEINKVPRKLWEHSNPSSTAMAKFMQEVNKRRGLALSTFRDLHAYSITSRSAFWADVFSAASFIYEGAYEKVVDETLPVDAVPRWFEGVRLNFAENMLFSRTSSVAHNERSVAGKENDIVAVTEVREGLSSTRDVTWGELRAMAGRLASAMQAWGLQRGDRVMIVGANSVETLVVYLATAWVGALFSSSSTDTGVEGILQRTVQVDPTFVFMDDAALYNAKVVDLRQKMAGVVNGMAQCRHFLVVVAIPRFAHKPRDVSKTARTITWAAFLDKGKNYPVPEFVPVPFSDPSLICFSSGTTGVPKAIVHSVGGMALNFFKEGVLHEELAPQSVTLQYTTTGWIMYLAAIGVLLFGGRAVLYDGSPFQPDPTVLVRLMAEQKVTKLGISPRWMLELAKNNLAAREIADLSSLRCVTSTGSVLSDQLFEWFYDTAFPPHVHLANLSGGTDIAGCFGIPNPLTPVHVGGTQGPSIGIDVRIYDSLLPDGPGKEVPDGTPGELVAIHPFPNMPCMFWNDRHASPPNAVAPPGSRYHASYFSRFAHVWAHGDFCTIHPVTKNVVFFGRADGVLNPSGVRFGSAEIYGVVDRHFADRVQDSLCVGQRRPGIDQDERVFLFLRMKPGRKFDARLVDQVKEAIRRHLSQRHVPRFVFETPEIPTTVNLKKVELPVKQIVSGQTIKASGTLVNPQSLDFYYRFAKVEELVDKDKARWNL